MCNNAKLNQLETISHSKDQRCLPNSYDFYSLHISNIYYKYYKLLLNRTTTEKKLHIRDNRMDILKQKSFPEASRQIQLELSIASKWCMYIPRFENLLCSRSLSLDLISFWVQRYQNQSNPKVPKANLQKTNNPKEPNQSKFHEVLTIGFKLSCLKVTNLNKCSKFDLSWPLSQSFIIAEWIRRHH